MKFSEDFFDSLLKRNEIETYGENIAPETENDNISLNEILKDPQNIINAKILIWTFLLKGKLQSFSLQYIINLLNSE